jgi:predicted DNA-binding transcriptional regulator AlpA
MSHRHRLPDPFEPDVLVGGPELVRHLGMSRRSFYDAIERGSVPAPTARIGGRRKWRGDVLNAWARAGYPPEFSVNDAAILIEHDRKEAAEAGKQAVH